MSAATGAQSALDRFIIWTGGFGKWATAVWARVQALLVPLLPHSVASDGVQVALVATILLVAVLGLLLLLLPVVARRGGDGGAMSGAAKRRRGGQGTGDGDGAPKRARDALRRVLDGASDEAAAAEAALTFLRNTPSGKALLLEAAVGGGAGAGAGAGASASARSGGASKGKGKGRGKGKGGGRASPAPFVFLGGACNPTTWRADTAMPFLDAAGVTYYNPQVDEWHEGLVAIEAAAKEESDCVLFVISRDTRAVASMVEAAEYITSGRRVFLVIEEIPDGHRLSLDGGGGAAAAAAGGKRGHKGGEALTGSQLKDLNRGRRYLADVAERHGIKVYTELRPCLQALVAHHAASASRGP